MTLLATLEDFFRSQGQEPDPTDVAAQIALATASAGIRTYCGRTFDHVAGDSVTLDGTGTRTLLLPEHPVLAVSSVGVLEDGWDADPTLLVETTDYKLDDDGTLVRTWPYVWPARKLVVEVTYDHGYVLPGIDGATLPEDIQLVCLQLAARLYTRFTAGGEEISSEQIGTYQVTYETGANAAAELEPLERGLLTRFVDAYAQ